MKKASYKHRRDVEYDVRDLVYLKLRPYWQNSVALRRNEKLSQRYFGPYPFLARIGRVAYKLQLPAQSHIHLVFHVSQLKKAVPKSYPTQELPTILTPTLEWATAPGRLLDIRQSTRGDGTEVLVQWDGLPNWSPLGSR